MTGTMLQDSTTATSRTPLLAAIGIGSSVVLTAVGTFRGDTDHTVGDWLFSLGVAAVVAAVVFGLVVRTARRGDAGRRALILGVVAVLSVGVFWAGATTVIAAAALACALVERDARGSFGPLSKTAAGLAGVATIAVTVLAFLG